MFTKKSFDGFVLIELIISMLLAITIIGSLFEIYLINQKSDRLQSALSQLQENTITVSNILNSAIHQTGLLNCLRLSANFNVRAYQNYSFTVNEKLQGNTNEIIVKYMDNASAVLQSMSENSLVLSNDIKFNVEDLLIISNCEHAEIFKVASIKFHKNLQIIIPEQALFYHYSPPTEVAQFVINRYFIAKTNRKNTNKSPIYALYVENNKPQKLELIENINAMKMHYFINQNYLTKEIDSNQIIDWSKITAIGIDLTIHSPPLTKIIHLYANLP